MDSLLGTPVSVTVQVMRMRVSPVERVLGPLLWDPKFGGREATTGNASAVRRLVGPRSPSINVTISRQKNDFAFACNTYFGPKTLVACDQ